MAKGSMKRASQYGMALTGKTKKGVEMLVKRQIKIIRSALKENNIKN